MKAHLLDLPQTATNGLQFKKVDTLHLDNPFHFHKKCELVWIENGFGKRIVGDHVDNFAAGDLVLLGKDLPHIWQTDSASSHDRVPSRTKATVLYFPADIIESLTKEESIVFPVRDLMQRASRGLKFGGAVVKEVSGLMNLMEHNRGLSHLSYFIQLLDILTRSDDYISLAGINFEYPMEEKENDRINSAYRFLIRNFHRNITLAEVAAECNMAPTAFCRFFKSRTNRSVIQFLNELRVRHAVKLLQDNTIPIGEICYACGYNNLANFNKSFKLIRSTTPSDYRKLILQFERQEKKQVNEDSAIRVARMPVMTA